MEKREREEEGNGPYSVGADSIYSSQILYFQFGSLVLKFPPKYPICFNKSNVTPTDVSIQSFCKDFFIHYYAKF